MTTTFKITPQELNEEPTFHRIKTRAPYTEITDEMIAERARGANLACGDSIRVMATNHQYDEVIAQAMYLVTKRHERPKTIESDNGRQIHQVTEITMTVARVGDWVVFAPAEAVSEPAAPEKKKPAKAA